MSLRSGLLALASGAALGLATAAALGVGAFEEEAVIVVGPGERVDPAPDDPFDLDPLLAPDPGSPVAAAEDATERTVELAGGDVVTIRVLDAPALRLVAGDVAFLELAESALGEDGVLAGEADAHESDETDERSDEADASDARFAVYAVLSESGRAAWTPFAAEHANGHLLVELDGRPVDLVRPLGWSRGLRIAVFPDELTRTRWVETLELELH